MEELIIKLREYLLNNFNSKLQDFLNINDEDLTQHLKDLAEVYFYTPIRPQSYPYILIKQEKVKLNPLSFCSNKEEIELSLNLYIQNINKEIEKLCAYRYLACLKSLFKNPFNLADSYFTKLTESNIEEDYLNKKGLKASLKIVFYRITREVL